MINTLNPYKEQSALICPYTLMEEEALAWSILLFGRAVLLHPYPLPLPAPLQFLRDQDLIQIRSLVQSAEAVREKDKVLRGISQTLADTPGRGSLKYLIEALSREEQETQEEITELMKGRSFEKPLKESFTIDGPILLCLIHEWMMQEWEVENSLAIVDEQEKNLIQSWQENPEEKAVWQPADLLTSKSIETEIHCPPALTVWQELKDTLFPEPSILFTNQPWVWSKHYGLDPAEVISHSVPLPVLCPLTGATFQNQELNRLIRSKTEAMLPNKQAPDPRLALEEFQKALLEFGLPSEGRHRLFFPPLPSSGTLSSDRGNPDPLILLLPALT